MRLLITAALLGLSLAIPADAKAPAIGKFEGSNDIGSPKLAGSAAYKAGAYVLTAGGYNVSRTRDEFRFVWRKVNGDFSIETQVMFDGPGLTPHRKGGIMARANLSEGAAHIDASLHGDGPRSVVIRKTDGGPTETRELEAREPAVPAGTPAPMQSVLMERHGDRFDFVLRQNGKPDLTQSVELALPKEVYLGLFLSAHNPDVIEKATFTKVRFNKR